MPGRSTDTRPVSVTTTNASTAVTFTTGVLQASDVGRTITGSGIPAGATVATVTSTTAGTLSAAATASGLRSVTLGPAAHTALGFLGYSVESDAEAASYSVAANNAGTVDPARITDTLTAVSSRQRARS